MDVDGAVLIAVLRRVPPGGIEGVFPEGAASRVGREQAHDVAVGVGFAHVGMGRQHDRHAQSAAVAAPDGVAQGVRNLRRP